MVSPSAERFHLIVSLLPIMEMLLISLSRAPPVARVLMTISFVGLAVERLPLLAPMWRMAYRNFRRQSGLTVEAAIRELGPNTMADLGIQIPEPLVMDCIRLCCSLCLLESDPSIISPDVLSKDRDRFEHTRDEKYVEKAHRRGKVGWDVGRHIEVIPHYRRPHLTLVWTGPGRTVPKIVPRRGSIVHRNVVEKVPMGFGQ